MAQKSARIPFFGCLDVIVGLVVFVLHDVAPDASVTAISLPTRGREPAWRVTLKAQGVKDPVNLQVIDATGQARPDRGPTRDPLSRLMRQVHDGADTGFVWQFIIFLGGIAPAVKTLRTRPLA